MKSPKDMKVLQIDITNACVNKCSNCTRFCGHHNKPFFMDFETFKKAVDSYEGWNGMVGIIGGEPTLHPEFEKFANYLKEKRTKANLNLARKPIPDFQNYIFQNFTKGKSLAGLWCSLNSGYYRHFEIINETFQDQYLNDHNNKCLHQAILVTRKELGISDEEFYKRRDNCFAQNTWSATITPKGAFFCEVAAHLDMLFNGPGGWQIEKGWYNRTPDEFGDQLQWCEMCGLCLDVPQRISCDERDDITPLILEKLKSVESPKVAQGKYVVLDPQKYNPQDYHSFEGANDYMAAGDNIRTTSENKNYYPRCFKVLNKSEIHEAILNKEIKDWVIVTKDKNKGEEIAEELKNYVLNPGCMYKYKNSLIFNKLASSIREYIKEPQTFDINKIGQYYPNDKIVKFKNLNQTDNNHIVINILGIKFSFKRRING